MSVICLNQKDSCRRKELGFCVKQKNMTKIGIKLRDKEVCFLSIFFPIPMEIIFFYKFWILRLAKSWVQGYIKKKHRCFVEIVFPSSLVSIFSFFFGACVAVKFSCYTFKSGISASVCETRPRMSMGIQSKGTIFYDVVK